MTIEVESPIFIHSMFRAGSTYIFNTFRQAREGYLCYQEPLNEYLINAATEPEMLLKIDGEMQSILRHPHMDKPYFYEFHLISEKVGLSFKKEFSYDQFFSTDKHELIELSNYFRILQDDAVSRSVFQCCRTIGRVGGLKSEFGGSHVFLWRNPWDQWWSYKKDNCFDINNLLILNGKSLPSFLKELKESLKLPDFHDSSTLVEFNYFKEYTLDSVGSYKVFYALWCYAMLETKNHCDFSISIDELSESETYHSEVLGELRKMGVNSIDFADCSVPIAKYGYKDGEFFSDIEAYIHLLLLSHGYSSEEVKKLQLMSDKRQAEKKDSAEEDSSLRDAMRARELVLKMETEFVAARFIATDKHLQEITKLNQENTKLNKELQEVKESTSWLITTPIRSLGTMYLLLRQSRHTEKPKKFRRRLFSFWERINGTFMRSGFRFKLIRLSKKLGVYKTLRSLKYYILRTTVLAGNRKITVGEEKELTSDAQRIYTSLTNAISSNKQKK